MMTVRSNAPASCVDVLVLCGGLGSRLRPATGTAPKVLARINTRAFLDLVIGQIERFGFRRIILCTGYKADCIRQHYAAYQGNLHFVFSRETTPLGTAGALRRARRYIRSKTVLVLNGDSFCPVNLLDFLKFHTRKKSVFSMVIAGGARQRDQGSVLLDGARRIVGFEEKRVLRGSAGTNAGIYLFERTVIDRIPRTKPCSLEYDVFPQLVGSDCFGYITSYRCVDIGTPARYRAAQRALRDICD